MPKPFPTAVRMARGRMVRTGLLPTPRGRRNVFPLFRDAGPTLTRSEILDILSDPNRVTARERFGDDWIRDQGQRGSCFPAGTLVRLADGSSKPIESVRCLEEVLTAEGRTGTVVRTMVRRERQEVVRVKVWGHRHIRCTGEHPFLTRSGYKAAEELTKGDWVGIPKHMPAAHSWIEPFSLMPRPVGVKKQKSRQSEGKVVYQIPGKSKSTMHRTPVPERIELDVDFGFLIGLFLAEGCLNERKVTFTFHKDECETLAATVCDTLFRRFGVEATRVVRSNRCDVKWYGADWCRLLNVLCSTGSGNKRLHPCLAGGSPEFLEAVLEGWQAGDGLGDPDRRGGVTVSHSLAMGMYDIATALGHMPTVETLNVRVNSKHKIKKRRLRYIVAWPREGKAPPVFSKREQDDTHVWRKVAGVEPEPFDGWVFNLEVEGDNSYTAESVGVHNCNGYAAATALSKARALAGMPRVDLSGEYVYAHINGGRDQGSLLPDGMEHIVAHGVAPASMVPHELYQRERIESEAFDAAPRFRGLECYAIGNEHELFTALALGFVCVVATHHSQAFDRLDRDGVAAPSPGPGNHSVHLDDAIVLPSGELAGDLANSHGLRMYDRGRHRVTWERHLRTTIVHHAFYAVRAPSVDPQSTVPFPRPRRRR